MPLGTAPGCLPTVFTPGDHVLLIPTGGGFYNLLPSSAATEAELELAMQDELRDSAAIFRKRMMELGLR
jgi:hypothetical protein